MNTDTTTIETTPTATIQAGSPNGTMPPLQDGPITGRDILRTMEHITQHTQYLVDAFATLQAIESSTSEAMGAPADIAGQAKAEAVAAVVATREVTNQRILDMLETMYQDLRPAKPSRPLNPEEVELLTALASSAESLPKDEARDVMIRIVDRLS